MINPAQEVSRIAGENGDRLAVVCGGQRQTYRELHDRAQQVAHALDGLGIGRGECVALLLGNGVETLELLVGLTFGGFVRAPLYAHDAPSRHRYLLDLTQATALVVDADHYEALAPVLGECVHLRKVVVVGTSSMVDAAVRAGAAYSYEELVAAAPADPVDIDSSPDAPYQIRFSAGTTGLPKGILHDLQGWVNVGEETMAVLDRPLNATDRFLAAGPLTHASSMPVWPVLAAGGAVVVMQAFDAGRFLELVETERVTVSLVVPAMVQMLTRHADAGSRDLSSLDAVFYGTSPMPEETLVAGLRLWGNVMYQVYGQSESVPATALLPEHHKVDGTARERRRLRSAGVPLQRSQVRIVNEEDDEVPRGEVGEILIRTPGAMREIWRDPEATAARITPEGWVRTRDMGWMDEDGFLFLADRKEDMIISGGYNIWPAELENALADHPAVRESAVVGVAHPKWGETPCAHVVLEADSAEGVTDQDLIEWTRERLGSVKKLTGVRFVAELPRSPAGKVMRRVLREGSEDGAAGEAAQG